ncbi:beta-phosphoglucomutase family hydrolase [Pasteurella oralis]|uniref:Beta-phosphoglucomutase family hydrolase n=1 Tax=Pasteurella oralis TaxID=1071947 RepID=A0ABW4NRS4_9PAST|nr:beta-phosphoglucomutase family hydrolase [Pasteurella oralis]
MLDKQLFSQYAGLIFDMDGTLIDTMPCHAQAWLMVGEYYGYALQPEIMYKMAGAPLRTIAQAIMQEANMPLTLLQDVMRLKRQFGKALILNQAKLLPAANVAKHFYQQKAMALGTGSHREMTYLLLDKLDIAHCFEAVVTSEDVEKHKPAPDTFLRCAELIQVKPQDCLVFEDADLGVQAGLAAGMHVFDVRTCRLITE